jgi:predicted secreted protein
MKRLHGVMAVPMSLWMMASASPVMADSLNGKRVDYTLGERRPNKITRKSQVRVLTESSNGLKVAMQRNETLIVRLPDKGSTGSVWSLVAMPNSPLRLLSQTQQPARVPAGFVGAPGVHEFKFVISGKASFSRTTYLKLLQLRPFEKGIGGAKLWEIKVIVPAS